MEEMMIKALSDEIKMKIGKRIQDKRVERHVKTDDLAELMQIGKDQLSRIECGRAICKTEHLYLIAQYLNVSVDYLLFGDNRLQLSMEIEKMLQGCTNEELKTFKDMLTLLLHKT